ncbi:MAG: peptidase M64 N-terminal domain-containing protein [Bacteroidales bacterium]|nr:peptidase M64 N-terminal domain-containing protein [Bacteroidales bacterium]
MGWLQNKLIDTLEYGHYLFKVVDERSGKVLYSRGYSTLFREWQTTAEADTLTRAFTETVVMPYPKNPVRVIFYSRDSLNRFQETYSLKVDPDSYFIRPQQRMNFPSFVVLKNGSPSTKVDVVILPEGYTKNEDGDVYRGL